MEQFNDCARVGKEVVVVVVVVVPVLQLRKAHYPDGPRSVCARIGGVPFVSLIKSGFDQDLVKTSARR